MGSSCTTLPQGQPQLRLRQLPGGGRQMREITRNWTYLGSRGPRGPGTRPGRTRFQPERALVRFGWNLDVRRRRKASRGSEQPRRGGGCRRRAPGQSIAAAKGGGADGRQALHAPRGSAVAGSFGADRPPPNFLCFVNVQVSRPCPRPPIGNLELGSGLRMVTVTSSSIRAAVTWARRGWGWQGGAGGLDSPRGSAPSALQSSCQSHKREGLGSLGPDVETAGR